MERREVESFLAETDWFDLVHEAVLTCDREGRVTAWNTAAERLYGYARDEVLGRDVDDLLQTRYSQTASGEDASRESRAAWNGEVERRNAHGQSLFVDLRRSARRDASGAIRAVVETGRDLTQQKRDQAALRHSEYRYRNLFQAMAASFWELDFRLVGERVRGLGLKNPAAYEQYLLSNVEFVRALMRVTMIIDVNDQTIDLFAPGDRSRLTGSVEPYWPEASTDVYARSVVAAISGSPSYVAETRLRRADGSEFEALFTACFSPESVSRAKLLVGVLDISEQKKVRRLQDELAHASRVTVLGELTASIAHELNQPLGAIAASGDAALRWLRRPEPALEEVDQLIARTVADAHRAAGIIVRVRAMSQHRPRTSDLLALNDITREAMTFLQHEVEHHLAEFELELAPQLPAIRGDRIQLQQVIVNLVVNALQAMSSASVPRRFLRLRSHLSGSVVSLSVEDSGPGFSPEHGQRLFESFFSTKKEGLGLGLPVCRTIVEAHGGSLTASSEQPGGGACFTFSLPAAMAQVD